MNNIFQKIKGLHLERFSFWAILLLAAFVRFTGLAKRDFWYDEAFTGVAVKENFHDMIQMIINDVHPPLYYLSLKVFASFFNYSVFGIRLFSAVFGVLSIWALYILTKELFDAKVARYATLLAAISPFAIQYSQEARMYTMLVFFILISAYFFVKGLRTGHIKYYILWGIFTGLSMLTHYMGVIFSISYYFVFVVWELDISYKKIIAIGNKKEKIIEFFKKLLPSKQLLFGAGIAFLVFLPWLRIFIHHVLAKGNNLSWVKPASLGDIIITIQTFLFGTGLGEWSSGMPQPNELHNISHITIRVILSMLLVICVIYVMRRNNKGKVLSTLILSIGFMFLVYLLSATLPDQQYFVARYLLPGAFFIFIFIGLCLSYLPFRFSALILVGYLFLIYLIVPLQNSKGYNEMVLHLNKYEKNNFYMLNSFDYVIAKYYLGSDRLTLYNYGWPQYNPAYWAAIGPNIKRTENYDDMKNDPRALIVSNKPLVDNQYFSTSGLEIVDRYANILIYKFKQ